MTEDVYTIIQNEYKALKGDYVPGELNISNYGEDKTTTDEIATDFGLIGETAQNAADLQSGKKVNVWNSETGRYSVEDPRAAGLASGQYQYVAVYKNPDGTMTPRKAPPSPPPTVIEINSHALLRRLVVLSMR